MVTMVERENPDDRYMMYLKALLKVEGGQPGEARSILEKILRSKVRDEVDAKANVLLARCK